MNYLEKSNQITVSLRKSFQTTDCKMANRTCYGYKTTADGELATDETESAIVKWIFDRYLAGDSFGKILRNCTRSRKSSQHMGFVWFALSCFFVLFTLYG